MVGKGQNTNAPTISYLPRRHGEGAVRGGEYDYPTSSITRMTDITDLVIDDEDDSDSYNIDDSDAVLNSSGRRRGLSTGDIEDVKIKNSRNSRE